MLRSTALCKAFPTCHGASNTTSFQRHQLCPCNKQKAVSPYLLGPTASCHATPPIVLCRAGPTGHGSSNTACIMDPHICPGNKQNAVPPHPDAAAVGCHAAAYTASLQQTLDTCIVLWRAGATRHCSSDTACLVSPLLWQQVDGSASSCSGSFS